MRNNHQHHQYQHRGVARNVTVANNSGVSSHQRKQHLNERQQAK